MDKNVFGSEEFEDEHKKIPSMSQHNNLVKFHNMGIEKNPLKISIFMYSIFKEDNFVKSSYDGIEEGIKNYESEAIFIIIYFQNIFNIA